MSMAVEQSERERDNLTPRPHIDYFETETASFATSPGLGKHHHASRRRLGTPLAPG